MNARTTCRLRIVMAVFFAAAVKNRRTVVRSLKMALKLRGVRQNDCYVLLPIKTEQDIKLPAPDPFFITIFDCPHQSYGI